MAVKILMTEQKIEFPSRNRVCSDGDYILRFKIYASLSSIRYEVVVNI